MFLQIAYRMLINVDALNMVESVGNVTRRRTVPVVVPKAPGEYVVRWVPAISGESLAHRYQLEIVDLAKSKYPQCGNRLDYWSEQGELLKHWDLGFYKAQCEKCEKRQAPCPKDWECQLATTYTIQQSQGWRTQVETFQNAQKIEEEVVKNSLVEDIGGFLITADVPIRRTSCIRFSYLIPTLDATEASQLDNQFHVRGALKAESLKIQDKALQVPYYVQVGSVNYGGNIELELGCVGCYSLSDGCVNDDDCSLNVRRCIAIDSLRPIFEVQFGAKRSRNLPHSFLELAIAVISNKPIPLPPGSLPFNALLQEIAKKLNVYNKELGVNAKVIIFKTNALKENIEYEKALEKAINGFKDSVRGNVDGIEETDEVLTFLKKVKEACGLRCGGQ